jgi:hypothetical protein
MLHTIKFTEFDGVEWELNSISREGATELADAALAYFGAIKFRSISITGPGYKEEFDIPKRYIHVSIEFKLF